MINAVKIRKQEDLNLEEGQASTYAIIVSNQKLNGEGKETKVFGNLSEQNINFNMSKKLFDKFLKEEINMRTHYKYRCPNCLAGVNVSPSYSGFKCGNCGYGRKR